MSIRAARSVRGKAVMRRNCSLQAIRRGGGAEQATAAFDGIVDIGI